MWDVLGHLGLKGAGGTALRPGLSTGVDRPSFMGSSRRLQVHLNPLFPQYLSLFFICSIVILGLAGLVLGACISPRLERHQNTIQLTLGPVSGLSLLGPSYRPLGSSRVLRFVE